MRNHLNHMVLTGLVFLCLTVGAGTVMAESIEVLNPGFEAVTLADGNSSKSIPDWQQFGSTGTWNPTTALYPLEAPEGQNVAYLNSSGQFSGAWIAQVLPLTVAANTLYTLTVDVGRRSDISESLFKYFVRLSTPNYSVEDNDSLTPGAGEFLTSSVTMLVDPGHVAIGEQLKITLWSRYPQVNFDNVRFDATIVPEPISSILFIIGGATLGLTRLRKRK